jgi:hypothetical protein
MISRLEYTGFAVKTLDHDFICGMVTRSRVITGIKYYSYDKRIPRVRLNYLDRIKLNLIVIIIES